MKNAPSCQHGALLFYAFGISIAGSFRIRYTVFQPGNFILVLTGSVIGLNKNSPAWVNFCSPFMQQKTIILFLTLPARLDNLETPAAQKGRPCKCCGGRRSLR